MNRYIHPPFQRVAQALMAASFAAALPTLIAGPMGYAFGLLVAAAHALLLGLPAYLLLRRRRAADWGAALFAGFLIGATPAGCFALFRLSHASLNPFMTDAHQLAFLVGFLGFAGMGGGLVFRLVLGAPEPMIEIDPTIFE